MARADGRRLRNILTAVQFVERLRGSRRCGPIPETGYLKIVESILPHPQDEVSALSSLLPPLSAPCLLHLLQLLQPFSKQLHIGTDGSAQCHRGGDAADRQQSSGDSGNTAVERCSVGPFMLLVGIEGGIPGAGGENDAQLRDVWVSKPASTRRTKDDEVAGRRAFRRLRVSIELAI